jgi:putative Mg2+ transporter-C (MgtC) family protein
LSPPWNTDLQLLGQGLVALVLGGAIGWERELAGKWAGFRTHMLVCLASMLIVGLGRLLTIEFQKDVGVGTIQSDPMRLTEAIVTGIAFIGAGTVFRNRTANIAHGLTTAATLLSVGAVGIAVALDRYLLAVGVTLIILFVLRILGTLEKRALQLDGEARTPPRTSH